MKDTDKAALSSAIVEFRKKTMPIEEGVVEVCGLLAKDAPYLQSVAYFGFSKDGEFVVSGDESLLHPVVIEQLTRVLRSETEKREEADDGKE